MFGRDKRKKRQQTDTTRSTTRDASYMDTVSPAFIDTNWVDDSPRHDSSPSPDSGSSPSYDSSSSSSSSDSSSSSGGSDSSGGGGGGGE